MVKQVRDMEIDEISLVDRPANQHALVTIAKRAPEEEAMPDYFLEDGTAVDLDALEPGDVVYDEAGNGFEYYEEEVDDKTDKAEGANAAGVSKAFESKPTGFAAEVREMLSKAATDSDRDDIISKALERIEASEQVTQEAVSIAKAERTLRLEREYISKAAEYNVPIEPEQLGPVLMRAAESLSYEDCAVIHKALTAAGELIYEEAGYIGQGDNDEDPMNRVEAFVEQGISKAASAGQDSISKAQGMADYFTMHPEEYAAYKNAMSR